MNKTFVLNGSKIDFSIELVTKQLEAEANRLIDQAEIEVMKLIMDGYSPDQARAIVIGHIQNGTGFAAAFWNRQDALIRELENKLVAVPVMEYGKYKPNIKFKWVLGEVITHHCGDCLRLSKMEPMTLAEWRAMDTGLPTEGKTECSFGCQCMLEPIESDEDMKNTETVIDIPDPVEMAKRDLFVPVSKNISYNGDSSEYKGVLGRVLAAVDKTHNDGKLNPLFITDEIDTNLGCFTPARVVTTFRDGSKKYEYIGHHINLSPTCDHKNMTLAHELGHFIDYKGIGRAGEYTSINSPALSAWRNAVLESKQYKTLVRLRDTVKDEDMLEHLYYLLDMEELWARSYSQYIAMKSGDPVMLKELEMVLDRSILYQWNKNDFKAISKAFDEIFDELGWLL